MLLVRQAKPGFSIDLKRDQQPGVGATDGKLIRQSVATRKNRKDTPKPAAIRSNWQHHVSHAVTSRFDVVKVEKLKVASMTASAKGSAEESGKRVKQKQEPGASLRLHQVRLEKPRGPRGRGEARRTARLH